MRNDTSAFPVLLAAAAILLLTVMDALIKAVGQHGATFDIVAMRYMFGLIWAIPVVLVMRPPVPGPEMLRANGLRSVLVLSTAAFFFYALAKLPLVEASTLGYLAPLFMAIIARFVLGEAVARATGVAIVMGLAGVLVIAAGKGLGTGGFGGDGLGVAAALAAAVTYALSMVLLRARTASDPIVSIVCVQNLFAAAMALPISYMTGDPLSLLRAAWPQLAAIGLLGTVGHLLFAAAYKRAVAARIGAVEYTGFIWAVGLGIIWFDEWPSVSALVGAALIVSGSLLLLFKPSAKPAPATG